MLGVANLQEALELRLVGCKKPVLVLGALLPDEVPELVQNGFRCVLSDESEIAPLIRASLVARKKALVHLKVDTGMGRLGVSHGHAPSLLATVSQHPEITVEGIMTHLAAADESRSMTTRQMRHFKRVLALLYCQNTRGKSPKWIHAANSAGIVRVKESSLTLARPGISLYGAAPVKELQGQLKPVMTWKSRVVLIKDYPAGSTISYGATYRASRKVRGAIIAAGYADGYRRSFAGQAYVLCRGVRCPVLGRVTMDQIIADVSQAGAVVGDEVVLLGADPTVETLAAWDDTISYEIFTGIGQRVPRVLVD